MLSGRRHKGVRHEQATRDDRHRSTEGEISGKPGNTLIHTLRKIYGQSFAAGNPEAEKHHEVLLKAERDLLSQLRRDYETGHLKHKIRQRFKVRPPT